MMLMICCGIDANGNVLPVAWALVPTENTVWWTWFCNFLALCFERMTWEGVIFISDRDKGIASALSEVFPKCIPAHCCQHIADSVQSRFGVKCRPLFWKCVWAKTKEQFQEALKALKAEKVIAAAYVDNIPYKLWARYAFLASRYGHYTSNIVESLNSV
jgi:transposase-like protein